MSKRHSRARGIAETYIHLKYESNSLAERNIRLFLEEHVHSLAEKHFKSEVFLEVTIEDGSIIAKVKAGAPSLLVALAFYGDIRSGIDYLVDDAYQFSDSIVEQIKQENYVPDQAIIRAERRLGVPGKIQRFYKKLDKVNSQDYSSNQRQEIIDELKGELLSIVELLEAEEDREAFLTELPEFIKPAPNTPLPKPIPGAITNVIPRNEEDD